MIDTEKLLEIAVQVTQKRAELAALEKLFAIEAGNQPRMALASPPKSPRGRKPQQVERVYRVLAGNAGKAMTPKEITSSLTGIKLKYVQHVVAQLASEGRIDKLGLGQYRAKSSSAVG